MISFQNASTSAKFNHLTIVGAVEVVAASHSHDDMRVLEAQWDLGQYGISVSSKNARVASWAEAATKFNPIVWTEAGQICLDRAIIELAVKAPENVLGTPVWTKFVAGLRFDGFEVTEVRQPTSETNWPGEPLYSAHKELRRMLPNDVPSTDFREAASEVELLLDRHGFCVAKNHLTQATAAFQRGDWAAANAQMRSFFESYLNEIAIKLGYLGKDDTKQKRDFLGKLDPPFLLESYNEWHENTQKPQFIQGLWSRMHPAGSHPGLSEEDDATFRLQTTLITARLFLRRFNQRI